MTQEFCLFYRLPSQKVKCSQFKADSYAAARSYRDSLFKALHVKTIPHEIYVKIKDYVKKGK